MLRALLLAALSMSWAQAPEITRDEEGWPILVQPDGVPAPYERNPATLLDPEIDVHALNRALRDARLPVAIYQLDAGRARPPVKASQRYALVFRDGSFSALPLDDQHQRLERLALKGNVLLIATERVWLSIDLSQGLSSEGLLVASRIDRSATTRAHSAPARPTLPRGSFSACPATLSTDEAPAGARVENVERTLAPMVNRLASAGGVGGTVCLAVIDTPIFNAYMSGTGEMILTTALLRGVPADDELAGIMAHELGHWVVRSGSPEYVGALDSMNLEEQADLLAVRILARAGYPPTGLAFALAGWSEAGPPSPTHRTAVERIRVMVAELAWAPRRPSIASPPLRLLSEAQRQLPADDRLAVGAWEGP
ncbi:MAG: M48 family metalloprotease [Elusimicrobia bacterium]|nr:M48 family metalloprotease [Elusimicrobiota bacterium]